MTSRTSAYDEETSDAEARTNDDVERESLRNCRILICEDEPCTRMFVDILLSRAGARVSAVKDGRAAVQSIENANSDGDPFDVILMDMRMPKCDGYTASRHLRQIRCRIPIIAVTADSSDGDCKKCLDAGCDDYISKPLNHAVLIDAIVKHSHRRSLHDQWNEQDLC